MIFVRQSAPRRLAQGPAQGLLWYLCTIHRRILREILLQLPRRVFRTHSQYIHVHTYTDTSHHVN